MWQNRPVLLSESAGEKNSMIIGAPKSVSIFNGDDSTKLYFGNEEPLVAGGSLFTRYSSSLFENFVVCKTNKTYLVDGTKPEDYTIYTVSESYGCVAPGTFKACDLGYEISEGVTKHVIIWQSQGEWFFLIQTVSLI